MKLYFSHLRPGETPITSISEYLEVQGRYYRLAEQERDLRLKIKQQEDLGEVSPELLERLHALDQETDLVMYEFYHRLPGALVSRCPYCNVPIWVGVGIFSLMDNFWYHEDGSGRDWMPKESRCPHLFCVDGALNLNGHQPTEARAPIVAMTDRITMAAEVPFVKPRVLNLPTMVAVIHSIPVAEKYTAYPIVYFAEQQPDQMEFCIPWGRIEYVARDQSGVGTFIGRRSDVQDYDLEKWGRQGKLFWLDPQDEERLVRGPWEAFPYKDVRGRRHPYYIKDGQVYDLPDPQESTPVHRWEDPW